MGDLFELLNKPVHGTKAVLKRIIRQSFLKSNGLQGIGMNPENVPEEIMVCPYKTPLWRIGNQSDDKICTYHFTTGEVPRTIDCYLCKK